jgi:hypothetical protein
MTATERPPPLLQSLPVVYGRAELDNLVEQARQAEGIVVLFVCSDREAAAWARTHLEGARQCGTRSFDCGDTRVLFLQSGNNPLELAGATVGSVGLVPGRIHRHALYRQARAAHRG